MKRIVVIQKGNKENTVVITDHTKYLNLRDKIPPLE